jgi:hypothetical protein
MFAVRRSVPGNNEALDSPNSPPFPIHRRSWTENPRLHLFRALETNRPLNKYTQAYELFRCPSVRHQLFARVAARLIIMPDAFGRSVAEVGVPSQSPCINLVRRSDREVRRFHRFAFVRGGRRVGVPKHMSSAKWNPRPICFSLFMHFTWWAFAFARASAGSSIPARIAIAMTTSNSINANAWRQRREGRWFAGLVYHFLSTPRNVVISNFAEVPLIAL